MSLVALRAERELELEQNHTVVSIARALEQINDIESRADLQTRLSMLEDRVEKLTARRDEVDQTIESRLSVLRTTLESALEAIGSPTAVPSLGPPNGPPAVSPLDRTDFAAIVQAFQDVELTAPAPILPADALEKVRAEFEEKLMEARSDLRYEMFKVRDDWNEMGAPSDLDKVRKDLLAAVRASEEKASKAAVYLEELIVVQRAVIERQREQFSALLGRLSKQLAGHADELAETKDR